ncbi:PQ-loop domain-containing transporter [Mycoplasma sp. 1018B]|uniref:PQ-loop domain-containing transporter n=1 Tax=Mycoplasma sp. 1018B TaxID=2967302 RepID=UPI00211CFC89|nr:PQ-loop domain-containing transporter [Mycoplasma sp. 1018B]UUM19259.1 PQ-loop domain-containing transporter [Mycoplasma sp. 1018B]
MYTFFAINSNTPVLREIAVFLSIFVFIVTLSLSIPQLIHLLKVKKTHKDTKFISYWIFYIGLLGWMLFGGFNSPKNAASVYANAICSIIQSIVLYLLYKYSFKEQHKKVAPYILISTVTFSIIITIISILGLYLKINNSQEWSNNKDFATFLANFFPMVTCFAFLPQVLKSFETKNFGGMSIYMVLLFCINNIGWILLFVVLGLMSGFSNLATPIMYQSISLLIYGMQLQLMIRIKKGLNVSK